MGKVGPEKDSPPPLEPPPPPPPAGEEMRGAAMLAPTRVARAMKEVFILRCRMRRGDG